jgi:sugar phosphate isomerase/epimerase
MPLSRREILGGFGMAAAAAAQVQDGPRVPRPRTPPKPRTSPAVCLYSQHLIKIEYESLGMVLRDLGFDGANLAIVPGAHVPPEKASSDLMREIEAVSGVGLEVPLLSTSVTSAGDMNGRQVMAIAGFMGIPLVRTGPWRYGGALDMDARLTEVQRELLNFAAVARAYNVATCVQNLAGDYVGSAVWDFNTVMHGTDPRMIGFDFDPGCAVASLGPEGSVSALRMAQPRLRAVTVSDATFTKEGTQWKSAPCPLGEGAVDWPRFFGTLAQSRFNGPLTIEMRYQPKDEINAMRHDLAFVRKGISAAYGSAG